jgi:hypothetical protein
VLEILRNNSKLESLYAMTAQRAFQFCLQYKRLTEFRRLCEILRNHLANLNKYRDQRDRPDLSLPESLQLYLETRFEQLKVATELELWQEAFRSVEDIHGLMMLVKKSPKPQMMAIYYAKLTKIFWKSDSNLYHAYAWYKLYNLSRSYKKDFAPDDLKLMASAVVSSLGDAKISLGDAKSSLGDAKGSLGDATSLLDDAESSLGDAKSSLGDAKSSLGDAGSSLGDAGSSLGDTKASLGDVLGAVDSVRGAVRPQARRRALRAGAGEGPQPAHGQPAGLLARPQARHARGEPTQTTPRTGLHDADGARCGAAT